MVPAPEDAARSDLPPLRGGPIRLTILGAGAVGAASAAVAVARGHRVTLWSPRGHSTASIGDCVRAEGVLQGRFPVQVAADLGRALDQAEVVLLAVPGPAQAGVMRRLATVVQGTPAILVAPAAALSPLLLDRLLVARGLRIAVGALAVTPVIAERLAGDAVRILAVRQQLWLGAVPAGLAPAFVPLCQALFGAETVSLPDALAAALTDVTPLLLAAQALVPALGPQGQGRTDGSVATRNAVAATGLAAADPVALGRLARALVAERNALGRAFGLTLPDAATVFAGAGRLPRVVPERALAEAPHALAFLLALGRVAEVPLPLAQSMLTLFEVLSGRVLAESGVLAGLSPQRLARLLSAGAAAA